MTIQPTVSAPTLRAELAKPTGRPRRPNPVRIATVGTLAVIVLIVAYIILDSGALYTYHLLFLDASQLATGNEVEVGGIPVGSVRGISLTANEQADVTIVVNSSIGPLHEGTTAQVRSPSLAGVANRYITLTPGPNSTPTLPEDATLPTTATTSGVQLDELFDALNPRTLRGLQELIQGSATAYAGTGRALNTAIPYLPPTLAATDHLLSQLTSDEPALNRFLTATASTVSAIAARAPQLDELIGGTAQTFAAIGAEAGSLTNALRELPGTLADGNRVFVQLSPALGTLTELVDAAKPDLRSLPHLLESVSPLLAEAQTPVRDLATTVVGRQSGGLVAALRAAPALAHALAAAAPQTSAALRSAEPIAAFAAPYAPDLIGAFRSLGQSSSYYDADGHYARISPLFAAFATDATGTLTGVNPATGLANLKLHQTARCPGAAAAPPADGSAPWTAACSPAQVPSG